MERLTLKAKEEAFEANQKMSALKAQASAQASSDGEPSKVTTVCPLLPV